MNKNKTKQTEASTKYYIDGIKDAKRKDDIRELVCMMQDISGEKPHMWGKSIIGFGVYHYKYASGREGDWMKIGLSSRKDAITLYLMCDLSTVADKLVKLGKHKQGVGCLYIKHLSDVSIPVLKSLIKKSLKVK